MYVEIKLGSAALHGDTKPNWLSINISWEEISEFHQNLLYWDF